MKVMCIDDTHKHRIKHPSLRFGETYLSVGEAEDANGEACYIIPELPISVTFDGKWCKGPYYRKVRFIPLPDADEIEAAEFEAIVPNPNL